MHDDDKDQDQPIPYALTDLGWSYEPRHEPQRDDSDEQEVDR